MHTTNPEAQPLTVIDLKKIRTADAICFDFYLQDGKTISQMRVIKREDEKSPWEQTHVIPAHAMRTDYTNAWSTEPNADPNQTMRHCFEMIHTPDYTPTWQTVAQLMKVGDFLQIEWTANGGNDYAKEARLYTDSVKFVLIRKDRRLTFNIATSTCPDNSARMCRRS